MIEVLVATVGQDGLNLYKEMNLNCNCIIANQNGSWRYSEEKTDHGSVRIISTATKGVGINRNIALSNAVGDILLFADDDVKYYDGTLEHVIEAFDNTPEADVIAFGMDMIREGKLSARRVEPCKRRFIWNSMRFGACRIAIRRSSVLKYNLSFSELFGGGCKYSCGEDTIFLLECFRKKLKVYSHNYVLGTCDRDSSTWFSGYTEKYFFDYGALLACAFPKAKHLLKWYFAVKLKRKSGTAISKIIPLINSGIKAFPLLTAYSENTEA